MTLGALASCRSYEDLKGVGGTVIRTSFDHAKEEALKAALATPPSAPASVSAAASAAAAEASRPA